MAAEILAVAHRAAARLEPSTVRDVCGSSTARRRAWRVRAVPDERAPADRAECRC